MTHDWRGIYAVLVTPFQEDLSLDLPSLERQVAFCHACGVDGLVTPVVASEYFTLSDAERNQVIATVSAVNAGALPLVAGVSGNSGPHAAALAAEAAANGADAVMAMPPAGGHGKHSIIAIEAYYHRIARASGLPLMLQNAPEPIGASLSTSEVAALSAAVPRIEVVKEETAPNPQKVGKCVEEVGGSVGAVFGGQGGIYLFNELARGAVGTMPACEFADAMVGLMRLYQAGDEESARAVFDRLLPALVLERLYNVALMKVVLLRRGVITTPRTRAPMPALDGIDLAELDAVMAKLAPHLTCADYPYDARH